MRNPVRQLVVALRSWLALRAQPGLFRLADAALQFERVLLPRRWTYRDAAHALAGASRIQQEPDGVYRVTLPDHHGLTFFWPTAPDPNLWNLIEQEVDPRNPHCYTTPPIRLTLESRVLDVGACEGLFAFRCLREGLASEVIAFEPSPLMASVLARGAQANGVADRLRLVTSAVGAHTGTVMFDASAGEQAGCLAEGSSGGVTVPCTTLDDYCANAGLVLRPRDLIKVDAEGADWDVLKGAERTLRAGGPQVAVTTYHTDAHARQISTWLRAINPRYRLRLKGFAPWTPQPRPVLLLASLPDATAARGVGSAGAASRSPLPPPGKNARSSR